MRKLTCHCGGVEAQVHVPEKGFEKVLNMKGGYFAVITYSGRASDNNFIKHKEILENRLNEDKVSILGPDDFSLVKGEDLLTLYQFKTKTAQHYFCKVCGIHTHNRPRSNPKIYGVNIACVDGIKPFEIENVPINDGENHPLDQKK